MVEYMRPLNESGLEDVTPISSIIFIEIPESADTGVNVPVTVKKYRYIFGSSSRPFENPIE
jgi:hypothetical protein